MSNIWFRFYGEALNDPKVQRLPATLFKTWVNLLCIASQHDGILPSIEEVSFSLRMEEKQTRKQLLELIDCNLIDEENGHFHPHNWKKRQYKSDTSKERVRAFRERHNKQHGNVSVTLHVTPQETETEPEPESKKEDNKQGSITTYTRYPATDNPGGSVKHCTAETNNPLSIIQAFDQARVEVYGEESKRPWPMADDKTYAKRFQEAGATAELCLDLFRERMASRKAKGETPPGGLKYFDAALPELLLRQNTVLGKPLPEIGGQDHENYGRNTLGHASFHRQYDPRDPGRRAREIGEAIIAKRHAKYREQHSAMATEANQGNLGGTGQSDTSALPDF